MNYAGRYTNGPVEWYFRACMLETQRSRFWGFRRGCRAYRCILSRFKASEFAAGLIWVVVKIMVSFWVLIIIRHGTQKWP